MPLGPALPGFGRARAENQLDGRRLAEWACAGNETMRLATFRLAGPVGRPLRDRPLGRSYQLT